VRKEEHTNAHFLICLIALTIIRIIQYKILIFIGKETKNVWNWELGLSAKRINNALDSFEADAITGGYYRLTKPSDDMNLILNAFRVETGLKLPNISELRKLKYLFDKTKFCQCDSIS